MMFASLLLLLLLPLFADAMLPQYGRPVHSDTELITIRHVSSAHDRTRRSLSMPVNLHLEVHRSTGSSSLNLTRSPREHHAIPVFSMRNKTMTPVKLKDNMDQAVYVDHETSSVMMVERLGNENYQLAGTLNGVNFSHQLWPIQPHDSNDTGNHAIVKVDPKRKTFDKVFVDPRSTRNPGRVQAANPINFSHTRKKRKAKNTREKRKATHTREKRQATQQEVEVALFMDSWDYVSFLNVAGGDTQLASTLAQFYYAWVEEEINIRFGNLPSSTVAVNVEFKRLVISDDVDNPGPSWIPVSYDPRDVGEVNAVDVLLEMSGRNPSSTSTDGQASSLTPPVDHWMTMTGLTLWANDQEDVPIDVSGMSITNSLCSTSSVSVIENDWLGTVSLVAAHELAHVQGGLHDGDTGGTCSDADGYVMSTAYGIPIQTPATFYSFSPCSASQLEDFYADLDAENNNCALVENLAASQLNTPGMAAGQVFDLDMQCNRAYAGSVFCRQLAIDNGLDTMCQVSYCGTNGSACNTDFPLVPSTGASCGDGKWCIEGECVAAAGAPSRPPNCPQLDDTSVACTAETCNTDPIRCCAFCNRLSSLTPAASTTTTTALSTTSTASTTTTTAGTTSTTASSTTSTGSTTTTTASTTTTTASTTTTTGSTTTTTASTATTTASTTTTTASTTSTTASLTTTTASTTTTTASSTTSTASTTTSTVASISTSAAANTVAQPQFGNPLQLRTSASDGTTAAAGNAVAQPQHGNPLQLSTSNPSTPDSTQSAYWQQSAVGRTIYATRKMVLSCPKYY